MNGDPKQHAENAGTAEKAATASPPAEAPLLAHLDRLMEELHAHVPKALHDWDEEAIHRARVATRRLSAALDLVKPAVGKKRRKALERVLRNLRRRLGPLRDTDVMLGHLQELGGGAAKQREAGEGLGGGFGQQRGALPPGAGEKGRGAGGVAGP